MKRREAISVVMLMTAALLLGCENWRGGKEKSERSDSGKMADTSKDSMKTSSTGKSLYDRLGGEPAIRAVVSDFVDRSAADPKVNFTRKGTPKEWQATPEAVQQLKTRLTEFVAQGTGGPTKYTGDDMRRVHTGMKITNDEFNAMGEHLKASLRKHNVRQREQDELMAIIESTRKDVVGL